MYHVHFDDDRGVYRVYRYPTDDCKSGYGHEPVCVAVRSSATEAFDVRDNMNECLPGPPDGSDHDMDEQCTTDRNDVCVFCGAYHGAPCVECGGRGYHRENCPETEGEVGPCRIS